MILYLFKKSKVVIPLLNLQIPIYVEMNTLRMKIF